MSTSFTSPGPNRPRSSSRPPSPSDLDHSSKGEDADILSNLPVREPVSSNALKSTEEGEEDGEDERMDMKLIQDFADKVQRHRSVTAKTSRMKISIPKRGEKDFEPLKETVNLQEMMLRRSREALFNALAGVRGSGSKSMSHALLTPASPCPRVVIARGHLLDSMGMTIRASSSVDKGKSRIELLPEEALYLLERGTLQIWIGEEAETAEDEKLGVGEWNDEEYGISGAIEMGVKEGFGTFVGRDGLSWERYQAYAYLRRLGYIVQRTRRFLPAHFSASPASSNRRYVDKQDIQLPPFRTWWLNIPSWIVGLFECLVRGLLSISRTLGHVGLRLHSGAAGHNLFAGTLLRSWGGLTYSSLFAHLRMVPTTHLQPLPTRPSPAPIKSAYEALELNPYLPFWNVWKPATPWSKTKWDKGSEQGLQWQKPDYVVAVVGARSTHLPSIHQLAEVFDEIPDEPTSPVKKLGPQYERKPFARLRSPVDPPWSLSGPACAQRSGAAFKPQRNLMGTLRNGDRALVVAVNDSGNTGWVRFGRTGFAEAAII